MAQLAPVIGQQALDTETGRPVWWDGIGWSYVQPQSTPTSRSFHEPECPVSPPLGPQKRPDRLPLSFAQGRLWLIDQLRGETTEYNMPESVHLLGELDVHALRQAMHEVVVRHESLRTHFAIVDGQPVQLIEPEISIDLPLEDLSALEETSRLERLAEAQHAEWLRPFDLARGPLFRMRLLKLSKHEHVLLRTFHHIVFDFWSQGVLNREFTLLYNSFHQGSHNLPDSLPVQYADFTLWQRELLSEATLRPLLEYWKKQLAEIPEELALPRDRMRSPEPTFKAGTCLQSFHAGQVAALQRMAHKHGATPYMVLLTGFAALLQRYSGQEDIVVGSPIANRQEPQLEHLIGFFVNTLALRVRVTRNASFLELLSAVRETTLDAYLHQDLPFERLVEELSPNRSLNSTPVFQVTLAFQNVPVQEQQLEGLVIRAERIRGPELRTRFDLELHIFQREAGIDLLWAFHRDLFDEWRIEQMARHYQTLLESALLQPEMPVRELDLLLPQERGQLLVGWNGRGNGSPGSVCLHQRFEKLAAENPDTLALVFENRQLTYEQMNQMANQLAHRLKRLGVGPEVRVGVCAEPALELMLAIVAILKAGGAYVPLDPNHPPERLQYVIQDSGVRHLLTQRHLQKMVTSDSTTVIELDDWNAFVDEPQWNPKNDMVPQNVAYVIYTSGSTGRPKGVEVTHDNVCRLFNCTQDWFGFGSGDIWTLFHSVAFDFSVWEIWGALLYGGRLVIVPHWVCRSPEELLKLLIRERVTVMNQTPSAFQQLIPAEEHRRKFEDQRLFLRTIIFGGEALDFRILRAWTQMYPEHEVTLINMYGITETTVHVTYYPIRDVAAQGFSSVVGQPLPDLRCYLLDENMQLAPPGVAGELYVGGAGLARGYLGRPDLTATRFVPDPFSEAPGKRLYKSGDLARFRQDGSLEYIGRIDHQVKIRGYRIELGEIEAALKDYPRLRDALVLLRGEGEEKYLAAYVVARESQEEESEDPRSHLAYWQELYESTYDDGAASSDFDIVGWNSSYTGAAIPGPEMRIWVEETVKRIAKLEPRRVLEIGCGTGLLLLRLAAQCEHYIGLDFSSEALARIAKSFQGRENPHIELQAGFAHDLSAVEDGSVDLVVLNSIIQYFPNVGYLLQVLKEAVRVTRAGGHIFVGDVRNLRLLSAFHASVEVFKADDQTDASALWQRVSQAVQTEKELVLDPKLFEELWRHWGQIRRVSVLPKAGSYDNELSRFRYDVVLELGQDKQELAAPSKWINWNANQDWRQEVVTFLSQNPGHAAGVRVVPDKRSSSSVKAIDYLRKHRGEHRTMAALRTICQTGEGQDPDELMRWANSRGIELCWQEFGEDGTYQVVFNPQWRRADAKSQIPASYLNRFGNAPVQTTATARLVPLLRQYLGQRLPEYMVPAAIMVLPSWPLTPNRKIDRAALPSAKRCSSKGYRAPRIAREKVLCRIFAEMLSLESVGLDDNFFELGGHSLMATRLIARLRTELDAELPLRMIFEYPTVAELAPQLDKAAKAQAALAPCTRTRNLPLSFAQQRLWFINQLEGTSAQYNAAEAFRIRGRLDLQALQRATDAIIDRHESLRTHFGQIEGEPVQIIEAVLKITIPIEDISSLNPQEQQARIGSALFGEWKKSFDLTQGPLLRITLLKLGECDHVLLRTFHHIVSDAWSLGIFNQEFAVLYEAFHQGKTDPLEPLPVQYADFTLWQRESLSEDALAPHLAYWRHNLAGIPEQLSLPTDRPRTSPPTYEAELLVTAMAVKCLERLKHLQRESDVTLYMSLLAAFAILLQRYSGQDDIILGSPVANRRDTQTERMIGFFVNSLVLRIRISPEGSFRSLLSAVRKTTLNAYEHQDLPFERLVEELSPSRNLSVSPIYQVVFALQNAPVAKQHLQGLEIERLPNQKLQVRFDLELHASETDEGIRFSWVYKRDLLDRWRIEQMARHYLQILDWVAAHPDAPLARLSMISSQEVQLLLRECSGIELPPFESTVVTHFERQVSASSGSTALVCGTEFLSYATLNRRANQLARHLRKLGIGPETVVGICLPRSVEFVVSVLAVLKAGGAYLPLDPHYASERLVKMVEDSGSELVITAQSQLDLLREQRKKTVLVEDCAEWLDENPDNPAFHVESHQLAYVIYTSGSTGSPNGVGVTHASLVHSTLARREVYSSHVERYLLVSSFAFDSSVAGLFWTLTQGGALHLLQENTHADVQAMTHHIEREKITHILCLPSVYLEMLRGAPERLRSLKVVIVAGESCPLELTARHDKYLPAPELYNEYGPTEAAVWSTVYRHRAPLEQQSVPIGRPIANTRVCILDSQGELVPKGVPGHLYISGVGLAQGYLNRPKLTAARFLPNPFARQPGDRMYRTGDRARLLADGNLEFLGREDGQVKLRGFRIELGEIETALRTNASVQDAVVLLLKDQRLAGYVVLNPGADIDGDALRGHLPNKLPEYMIPAAIMILPAWPLTANGKVDRKALPTPEARIRTYQPPRTPDEEVLCEIFAQVLDVDRVGLQDNFFDLGGHSLMANRLVNQIRSTMGLDLPLRAVFESATVAELAKYLRSETGSSLPPLEPQTRPQRLPLSYAQQRLWFIDQLEGASTEYNMPDALHLKGNLNVPALRQAVNAIVQRHESLRTRFTEENGEALQIVIPRMPIDVRLEDLTGLENEEREKRILAEQRWEWNEAFDLSRGPLLRIRLLKVGEREYILLRCFHHIVSDGWSMEVLNRELTTFYESFQAGRPDPLPPLRVQYADYALWQREWLNDQTLGTSLDYWKQQLAGIPEQLGLMEDYPRPERQTFEAGLCRLTIPMATTAGLKSLGRSRNVTLFMALLSAYAVLLHRHSGQNDIVIGTPVANRRDQQLEQLIGVFVNSLAVRVQVHSTNSFREVLAAVRATALAAYAHQDLPFERLVEVLSPRRVMNRAPIFQCMFLLQNVPLEAPELAGMKIEPVRSPEVRTYFDLELYAREHDGQIEIRWVYNRNLFEHSRMEQMAWGLRNLLESIQANPEACVGELNILDQAQRLRLLGEWNATGVEYPRTECIHDMFEEQARLQSHCVGARFGDQQLTYAQLDKKSNQLARHLQALGVRPDCFVGICMDRSMEMLIAILGILKAGGAYVPLDPGYPEERLRFMTEDAGFDVLLTRQSLLARLPKFRGRVVCLDSGWPQINRNETDCPPHAAIGGNAAYVIYTSGSTGWPKGVVVSHGAACNQISWMKSEFPLNALHRVLQRTSISFDASIAEIFLALSTGAELVLADSRANDVDYLLKLIAERNITYIDLPPSLLEVILAHPRIADCSSLEYVVCGGESLSLDLWEHFREAMQAKMYNLYGPTEATVQSTFHNCTHGGGRRTIPIGSPIANTQIYLLNDLMEPVPLGAPGEIYIGGKGLARGYWRRMDTTAERFLPNPFSLRPGEHLYRTGDLALQDTRGRLEFLGRVDHQVKIRGYRIELGEIEAVLQRHPKVQAAVVSTRQQGNNTKLVGYAVAYPDAILNVDELHSYVKKELPEHSRPTQLMLLKQLPLTVTGKIDRNSLPVPEELRDVFAPPGTPVEMRLAEIWQDVLGVAKIGLDDNFFDLGGHSLLIARVRIKLRDKIGQDLPIIDFFAFPTIRTMARRLEQPEQAESLTDNKQRAHLQRQYFLRQTRPHVLREQ